LSVELLDQAGPQWHVSLFCRYSWCSATAP
jgi:hypothetical protein